MPACQFVWIQALVYFSSSFDFFWWTPSHASLEAALFGGLASVAKHQACMAVTQWFGSNLLDYCNSSRCKQMNSYSQMRTTKRKYVSNHSSRRHKQSLFKTLCNHFPPPLLQTNLDQDAMVSEKVGACTDVCVQGKLQHRQVKYWQIFYFLVSEAKYWHVWHCTESRVLNAKSTLQHLEIEAEIYSRA